MGVQNSIQAASEAKKSTFLSILGIGDDEPSEVTTVGPKPILLKANFMTILPEYLQKESDKTIRYAIKYEVFYGTQSENWTETGIVSHLHTSKQSFKFHYDLGLQDHSFYCKTSFCLKADEFVDTRTQDSKNEKKSPRKMSLEMTDRWEYNYSGTFEMPTTNQFEFKNSKQLTSNIPLKSGSKQYVKDQTHLLMKISEDKPVFTNNVEFSVTGKFEGEEDMLRLDVNTDSLSGDQRTLLYSTEPIGQAGSMNNRTGLHYFERIKIDAESIKQVQTRHLSIIFEVVRVKVDKKGKQKTNILGSVECDLDSIMALDECNMMQLNIMKSESKIRGTLSLGGCVVQPVYSFLDYKISHDLNIVPVVIIDYSLSNLTFDGKNQCLHTLKKGENNDYITVLESIQNAYQHISKFMLGFGIGGKTLPKQMNASDVFSLSGNMFNPIIESDQLVQKYGEAFEKVRISLPVHFAPIFKTVCEYAQFEKTGSHNTFYKVFYITP